MKVKLVTIAICEGCLEGIGEECHTPGCAFFLHDVSTGMAIDPAMYEVKNEWNSEKQIKALDVIGDRTALAELDKPREHLP